MHRKSNVMLSLFFTHSLANTFAVSNCNQFIAVFPALTAFAHLQSHATGEHLVMGWAVPGVLPYSGTSWLAQQGGLDT